jgi:hypothetical protein
MLSQMQRLIADVDGRYATDTELQFMQDYLTSFNLRLSAYIKLQNAESMIVQQVYTRLQRVDSNLLRHGNEDISAKWKRDTIRVLRYSAIAVLLNDPDALRERFLFWFQTIMKAFGAQQSCEATYQIMQEVVRQHLTAAEANLVCSILELNRTALGAR